MIDNLIDNSTRYSIIKSVRTSYKDIERPALIRRTTIAAQQRQDIKGGFKEEDGDNGIIIRIDLFPFENRSK